MGLHMKELIFDKIKDPFDFASFKLELGEEIPIYQYQPLLGRYLYAKHVYPGLPTEEAIIKVDLEYSEFRPAPRAQAVNVPCGGCGGGDVR